MHHKASKTWMVILSSFLLWSFNNFNSFSIVANAQAFAIYSDDADQNSFGSLFVATYPKGAKIIVNGKVAGLTPLRLDSLESGSLSISLEKAGYPVRNEVVDIQEGREQKLLITLIDSIPAVLDIRSLPDRAEWWIDGKIKGVTPQLLDKIPDGHHQILVRKPGYHEWTGSFEAEKGQLIQILAKLKAKKYSVTVLTEPEQADVQILNGQDSYTPGMLMEPGQHLFWISAPGYEPTKGRVTLKDRDWVGLVRLKKISIPTPKSLAKKPTYKKSYKKPVDKIQKQKDEVVNKFAFKAVDPADGEAKTIAGLLAGAADDIKNGRLLSPLMDNARDKYQQILVLDPKHPLATKGLQQVNRLAKSAYLNFVRIFPVARKDRAERFLGRINSLGLPGFLLPTTVKGEPYFRVCAGLFPDRKKAVIALRKIQDSFGLNDVVLRRYRSSLYKPGSGS
ncbi:MAG: PEGA domain-containing protein [Magnetococcales bacterium]|nr:PEGA domain-containing protein [Magnetococcales bacterium]